jgi:arylsulfatase A-like enzyme
LELLGVSPPHGAGVSLAAIIVGRADGQIADRAIFMQRRDYETRMVDNVAVKGRKFAVRRGPYKLIVADEEQTTELFDLDTDPRELDNLAARKPDVVRELRAQIDAWQGAAIGRAPGRELDPSDLEALRALGYQR